MNNKFLATISPLFLFAILFSNVFYAQDNSNSRVKMKPVKPETLKVLYNFTIKSKVLDEERKIIVHLPKGYDATSIDAYSVIYMLDGGNYDMLMAKVADSLFAANKMSKVIVVGIENIRRGYDFTPPYEKYGRGDIRKNGNGDKFINFIKKELIPVVNQKFKTNNHKTLVGHSWGGAFATYLLSKSPELFDGFFIFSPTFLYRSTIEESTRRLRTDLNSKFNENIKLPKFIYISLGENEQERFKNSAQYFATYLKINIHSSIEFKFEVSENADHMKNPVISIPRALTHFWKIYIK